jgi:hypothetical protein
LLEPGGPGGETATGADEDAAGPDPDRRRVALLAQVVAGRLLAKGALSIPHQDLHGIEAHHGGSVAPK